MKNIKTIANVFFWITAVSVPASLLLCFAIGETQIYGTLGVIKNIWIMYIFIIFGLISISCGLRLKKNNERYLKNIIVAVICIPLLALFGSFRFAFGSTISYNNTEIIKEVEEETRIDLPNNIEMITEDLGDYKESYFKITDGNERQEFFNYAEKNFDKSLDVGIVSLLPIWVQMEIEDFEYCLFYNATTREYNRSPATEIDNNCIFIAIDTEINRTVIISDYVIGPSRPNPTY